MTDPVSIREQHGVRRWQGDRVLIDPEDVLESHSGALGGAGAC